ncbi:MULTISPECIES: AAA family ATPase [unclassified Microbacterium]|uniref:AAA family ATPase n=1 Tax=unclassified Microbacterium TaxID=2609290 RepID=UPI0012FBE4EC|nr:AAA family ATPase [Microbacterium sp. MAH-37]MVQ42755.1 AAA family ATPase [Microbacterium sp. MAH-37]
MPRILVTGMSGTGKSTLLAELARRGHRTVDTDYDGWTTADGLWDEARMQALLREHDHLIVQGTVENQGRFYDRFAHIVLLSAPIDVMIERVSRRTNNPYGHSTEDQDEIRRNTRDVEPLLRRGATIELDARRSIPDLADEVESLL